MDNPRSLRPIEEPRSKSQNSSQDTSIQSSLAQPTPSQNENTGEPSVYPLAVFGAILPSYIATNTEVSLIITKPYLSLAHEYNMKKTSLSDFGPSRVIAFRRGICSIIAPLSTRLWDSGGFPWSVSSRLGILLFVVRDSLNLFPACHGSNGPNWREETSRLAKIGITCENRWYSHRA